MNRGIIIGVHLQEIGLRLQRLSMSVSGTKLIGVRDIADTVGDNNLRDIHQKLRVLTEEHEDDLYPEDDEE